MFFRSNTRYPQAPASSWTPANWSSDDGELVGWWRADAGAFDAVTGGNSCDHGDIVYRLEDQSGKGYHLQSGMSGIDATKLPVYVEPPYGLPFLRWNQRSTGGTTSSLTHPNSAALYRDDCAIISGADRVDAFAVIRINPSTSTGDHYIAPVNILHSAPTLGNAYDKLSWFRADIRHRSTTTTDAGIRHVYQQNHRVWQKVTPTDDAIPSPYTYTFTSGSSGGGGYSVSNANHAGFDQFNRSCWFQSWAYSNRDRTPWATGGGTNGRVLYSGSQPSPLNTTTATSYPTANSNRLLLNFSHWRDYGNHEVNEIDLGEVIIVKNLKHAKEQIEGYLAHRWGISRNLYDSIFGNSPAAVNAEPLRRRREFHPFTGMPGSFAIPVDPAWTPGRKIASVRGWYDADYSGRRFVGGPTVHCTSIHDRSGYGSPLNGNLYHGVLFGTGRTIGGKPTLSVRQTIDGISSSISNLDIPNSAMSSLHGASGITVAAVLKPTSTSGTHTWFEWRDNTASGYGVRCGWSNNGSLKMYAARWLNANESSTTYGATTISTAFAYLCIWRFDLANGTRQLWLNGGLDGETTGLTTGTFASSGGDSTGAVYNTIANNADSASGDAGELLWCNEALSTTDRQKVEGYLAWKWGLDSFLPKSHPYGSGPPT